MSNYSEKLMRKYKSKVQNLREDLIKFALGSIRKTDLYIEQHITDLDFLEAQGVDISDLVKELKQKEKKIERKREVLGLIYRIKDKEDITNLRLKVLKVLGKTKFVSKKWLAKVKDTAGDKERKARYLKWQERQKEEAEKGKKKDKQKKKECIHPAFKRIGKTRSGKCLKCGKTVKLTPKQIREGRR
jgi:hypothetical protein